MKKLCLFAATLVASMGSASAADLPSRNAPDLFSPTPASPWSGFYLGAQVGYGWGGDQTQIDVPGFPFTLVAPDYDSSGFAGGVHAGFNYQTGLVVIGLEGDLELAGVANATVTTFEGRRASSP